MRRINVEDEKQHSGIFGITSKRTDGPSLPIFLQGSYTENDCHCKLTQKVANNVSKQRENCARTTVGCRQRYSNRQPSDERMIKTDLQQTTGCLIAMPSRPRNCLTHTWKVPVALCMGTGTVRALVHPPERSTY